MPSFSSAAASNRALQFWSSHLNSASQSLDIVLDKTRTQASTASPRAHVPLRGLPDAIWHKLPAAAGTTSGIILLAAFHSFLSRISRQELITLGCQPTQLLMPQASSVFTQAGSTQQAAVPLACPALGSDDTLLTHAKKLHALLLAMAPHASISLADIGVIMGIESASSMQHPVFQAAVLVAPAAAAAERAATRLDVALLLVPPVRRGQGSRGHGLQVLFTYNTGLFTEQGAAAMARHFEVHLAEAVRGPTVPDGEAPCLMPLKQVSLMDPVERQLVLKGFNQTDVPYETKALVHTVFSEHATATPDAPCVVFEDYVYSYGQINGAANRIAHYLRNKAGVQRGSVVGVLLLRSPVMVAALLGVLKTGAAYLPLDHHHPESRIEFMLKDSSAKAVLTQQDLLYKLPTQAAFTAMGMHPLLLYPDKAMPAANVKVRNGLPVPALLSPDALGAACDERSDWQLWQLGRPEDTCCIIYTSGSTGKPKGVLVKHKGLSAYTAWFRAHFSITPDDVFIQKTPTNFDASVDELWTSLSAGATLVVAPPEAHRDVHTVMQLITRHGVTTASAVPSQLHLLAKEILVLHGPAAAAAAEAPCASLLRMLSGGEALTSTMAQDIRAALPHCELHNTYGPTETTVGITSWLYTSSPADGSSTPTNAATIPIGKGIHNSRLYVLDESLEPVPVGVPGQLFISGVSVSGGYLNRPDLNATTFVPNPFCEEPGTHTHAMYRTGDLVRWLPGALPPELGSLEFLGRLDHQVKLRGFRIELQEVEAVLGAVAGVSQVAATLARNATTGQDQLVAWVSPNTLVRQDLVQQLQGALPEYMIPSAVVLMDQLPLLPSEKVNRKALPAPDFSRDSVRPPSKAQAASIIIAAATAAAIAASSTATTAAIVPAATIAEGTGAAPAVVKNTAAVLTASGLAPVTTDAAAAALPAPSDQVAAADGSAALPGAKKSVIIAMFGRARNSVKGGKSVDKGGVRVPGTTANQTAPAHDRAPVQSVQLVESNQCQSAKAALQDSKPSPAPAATPAESLMQFVAGAWAEVLGVEASTLALDDDFFALGGNSLLCGRMNSRIRTGLSIPAMSGMLIYQYPTLAAFTAAVGDAGGKRPTDSTGDSSVGSARDSDSLSNSTSDKTTSTIGHYTSTGSNSSQRSSAAVPGLTEFVAGAWAEALGTDAASLCPEDDFFVLGGNSLLCGKMNSRIRTSLSIPGMSGMLIYKHPTLAGFTAAVADAGAVAPSSSTATAAAGATSGVIEKITEKEPVLEREVSEVGQLPSEAGSFVMSRRASGLIRVGSPSPNSLTSSGRTGSWDPSCASFGPNFDINGSLTCGGSASLTATNSFTSAGSCFGPFSPTAASVAATATVAAAVAAAADSRPGSRAGSCCNSFNGTGVDHEMEEFAASMAAYKAAFAAASAAIAATAEMHHARAKDGSVLPGVYASSTNVQSGTAVQRPGSSNSNMNASSFLQYRGPVGLAYETHKQGSMINGANAVTTEWNVGFRHLAPPIPGADFPVSPRLIPNSNGINGCITDMMSAEAARSNGAIAIPANSDGKKAPGSTKPETASKIGPQNDIRQQVRVSVFWASVVQVLLLAAIGPVSAVLAVGPYIGILLLFARYGWFATAFFPGFEMAGWLLGVAWVVVAKWVIIGRYREGVKPLWGSYYIRHWLVNVMVLGARGTIVPLLRRTELLNWFYRALGVKVGRDVIIDTDDLQGFDLITLKNDCSLESHSGITGITYAAGQDKDEYPLGTMRMQAAVVGEQAVVGPHAMVVGSTVADGALVEPCTATTNPDDIWGLDPKLGTAVLAGVRAQAKPLGVGSALLSLLTVSLLFSLLVVPTTVGLVCYWLWLAGRDASMLMVTMRDTLDCVLRWPGEASAPATNSVCSSLMMATLKAMIIAPVSALTLGQIMVMQVIPAKWILMGKVRPSASLDLTRTNQHSWWQLFKSHVNRCLLEHPIVRGAVFIWTGTALFNAWLRSLGSKVGQQAWIGEDLTLHEHDLVEVGDCVSVCSGVTLMPSAALGSAKIRIMPGSDVTNQTALYPGVTVKSGAVLGVFTYAAAGRTFPRDSITQGPLVLRPGYPDPDTEACQLPPAGTKSKKTAMNNADDPCADRLVGWWHYLKFNLGYIGAMLLIVPVSATITAAPSYVVTSVLLFQYGVLPALLAAPLTWALGLGLMIGIMALLKRILLPRCTGKHPFYSYTHTAWMIEGILLYFHQAGVLRALSGSQMAVWYYRALGAKIGKNVMLQSLHSQEPDCITIEDGAVIDEMTFVMGHTVENRCLKFHDVHIGNRVTIGCGSCVLPGCHISDDACIGDVSLVMKGETVPAGAVWRGVPAVPC